MQRDHRGDRGPSGLRYGLRRQQRLDAWILRRTNRHWHIVHIAGAVHRSMALIHEKVTSKLRWIDFQKFVSVPFFGGIPAFAAQGSLDCDTRSVCVCFSNMPSGHLLLVVAGWRVVGVDDVIVGGAVGGVLLSRFDGVRAGNLQQHLGLSEKGKHLYTTQSQCFERSFLILPFTPSSLPIWFLTRRRAPHAPFIAP